MNKIGEYLTRIPGDYYLAGAVRQNCATFVTDDLSDAIDYCKKRQPKTWSNYRVTHVVIEPEEIQWSIIWPKVCKVHHGKKLLPVSKHEPRVTISSPHEAVRPRSLRQKYFSRKEGCYYCASTKGMEADPFLVTSNLADAVSYAKKRQANAQFRIRVVYVMIDEEIIQSTIVWPKLYKAYTRKKLLPIRYDGNVGRNG